MDALQRLKEVLAYSGLSVRAFAIKCGVSQPTLDKQLKGLRGISIETIMSVLYAFPDISAEWLMRGVGEMIISKRPNTAELDRINKLVNTIATLQDTIDAKSNTISNLKERIKQLETQLNSK